MAQCQSDALLVFKRDPPDRLALRDELTNQMARLDVPDLNPAVAAATDNSSLIKLQRRDAVIVGRQSVNGAHALERPHADGAVGAAGDQGVAAHLELSHKTSVALQNGKTFARFVSAYSLAVPTGARYLRCARIPDADVGVETAGDDPLAIESNGVNLAEMSLQRLDTSAFRDAPDLGHGIVTARYNSISVDL